MSIPQAANTGIIERPSKSEPRGKPSAAKIGCQELRAIELTSRIEASPQVLFADLVDGWAKRQPDRAAFEADDVARMVEYLLGEGGRNVSGSVLTIAPGSTPELPLQATRFSVH